jgi:DNA modification methylase
MPKVFKGIGRRLLNATDEFGKGLIESQEHTKENVEARKSAYEKFGFVPKSILDELSNYHDNWLDNYVDDAFGRAFQNAFADTRKVRAKAYARELRHLKDAVGDFDLSEFEKRHKGGHGLSQFGVGIARFCLIMWSDEGDTLFDPFSGRLPRLLIAHTMSRHAIGYDLSKAFARWNNARLERLQEEESQMLFPPGKGYRIEYFNRDSRQVHLDDNTADYVLTSPPYWHQEYYGDEPEQLGWIGTYQDFLDGMQAVLKECFRILKPGKFCTYVIQNMRDSDGSYVHYTADLSMLMRSAGFKIWDESLYRIGVLTAVTNRNVEARHTAKSHESIITARKMP